MTEKEIKELIKRVQEKNDQEAKRILIEKFIYEACTWAKKILKSVVYSNLITSSDKEIISLVYFPLEKSINTVKLDSPGCLSFRSYLYMLIKYQIFDEIKSTLNYRVINNFHHEVRILKQERRDERMAETTNIKNLNTQQTVEEILKFLATKNKNYYQIMALKVKGYKNEEICEKLKMSKSSFKSKFQYIKKLIRKEFDFPKSGEDL